MSTIQIATPFNIDIEFELAEFHRRLFAYFIDLALILIYIFSFIYILFESLAIHDNIGNTEAIWVFVILLPPLFYTFLSELLFNGQTLGKRILSVKVISLDGSEPTLGQYLLRWFLRFYEWGFIVFSLFWFNRMGFNILIAGGLVSVIIISISPKNQRLGDIIAGTVLVSTRSKLSVDDTILVNINSSNYEVSFPEVMRLSDRDINTIKNVITQARKTNKFDMCNKVAYKVQGVLKISSELYAMEFLEKILEDYNYLSTKE